MLTEDTCVTEPVDTAQRKRTVRAPQEARGRLPGGGRLGPNNPAKTKALPQHQLGGPSGEGGGVLRMPPPGTAGWAQFLMIWLVVYGMFRVTPWGSCSFTEVTELS